MHPYQKASEAIRSGEEKPLNLLKNIGLTAAGGGAAAFGSKALSKLIPSIGALTNKYVPDNLSKSGLSKIDSRFGGFIEGALKEGYSYDDLRDFMGEKIEKTLSNQSGDKNIIQQYSPELFEFLNSEMQKGRAPLEAGALAELQPNFKKKIKKMAEDHKTTFASILQTIFGQGQQGKQQGMAQPQQEQTQQTQQGQQSSGNGNALLLQAIQSINQRLGGQ